MTKKEFEEALSVIGNRELDSETADIKKQSKKTGSGRGLRNGLIGCAAAAAVIAVVTACVTAAVRSPKNTQNGNADNVLAAVTDVPDKAPTEAPLPSEVPYVLPTQTPAEVITDAPSKDPTVPPTEVPTAPPTPTPTPAPVYVPVDYPQPETASSEWFSDRALEVKPIYYANVSDQIESFYTSNLGANLISTTMFGEHENCPEVYYDPDTDEVVCFYHEFQKASGVTYDNDTLILFTHDVVLPNISIVSVADAVSVRNRSLWVFDSDTKTAGIIPLPDGLSRYEDLYLYNRSVWNGKVCISVNSDEIGHFIYFYDIRTGSFEKVLERKDNGWISGRFLAENIIELTEDGYSFYNTDTGKQVEIVGEYNYFVDGKVYSVRNNGWASRKDVKVAAYDAYTGEKLENETVLVQTVLDDGTMAFLNKNTTTGEETVMLTKYTMGCYTWSRDHRYFYAYSAANKRLICYSAADGLWFFTDVDDIREEQITLDGIDYIVFKNYGIAVSDDCSQVRLYYTRVLFEKETVPEYEDERVDSPCWDKYRELKMKNFEDEKWFSFSDEGMLHSESGVIHGRNVSDLTAFRDLLIECLESIVQKTDLTYTVENFEKSEYYFSCGILRMYFWRDGDKCYMDMIYNALQPRGGVDEVYEITPECYNRLMVHIFDYWSVSW